jgi:predicted phosphodiesterase
VSIRILHLTDLHTYPETKTLKDLWEGARHVLETESPEKFHFIVISGDLIRKAEKLSDYEQVGKFAELLAAEHLVRHEHRRVIFVPGNHDVDWSHTRLHSPEIPPEKFQENEFKKELERLKLWRYAPEDSDYRWDERDLESPRKLRKIDRSRYNERFKHFQDFIEGFYKNSSHPTHDRLFQLLKSDEDHWSAHVFQEEQIAFYGFNSCKGNDYYWNGAAIEEAAIRNAAQHARTHAHGMLLCAVWHHGLSGSRGAADYISVAELGRMRNAGFQVGFHGHTHQTQSQDLRPLLGDRFAVIGTGSFGASHIQRPGGALNEFAVVRLSGKRLVSQVYTRNDEHQGWARGKPDIFDLRPPVPSAVAMDDLSEVASHTRSVKVGCRLGIADIHVKFEDALVYGKVVLGIPRRNDVNIHHTDERVGPLVPGTLVEKEVSADSDCYFLRGNGERHSSIEWSYSISNAFALNQADLAMLGPIPSATPRILGHDSLVHQVYLRSGALTLAVQFEDATITSSTPLLESATLKAFRPSPNNPPEWIEDPHESQRHPSPTVAPTRVHVTLKNPTLGNRYALYWKLAQPGIPVDPFVSELVRDIVELCREPRSLYSKADDNFTQEMTGFVRRMFEPEPQDNPNPLPWVGHLWHAERKKLVPCFGDFPNRSWSSTFAYGQGLVGHAFRFAQPACYFHRNTSSSLIFQPPKIEAPHDSPGSHHSWILAIPIRVWPNKGPAVGVVGFTDYALDERNLDPRCQTLRDLARLHPGERSDPLVNKLIQVVSTAFWKVAGELQELSPLLREEAKRILKEHWSPPHHTK